MNEFSVQAQASFVGAPRLTAGKQQARSQELSITSCFELFSFLVEQGDNFHITFIASATSLFIQCLVMGRHKNLCAVTDCSVLKWDSNGKIPNNINVVLVLLNDGELSFLLAWEAAQFNNQLLWIVQMSGEEPSIAATWRLRLLYLEVSPGAISTGKAWLFCFVFLFNSRGLLSTLFLTVRWVAGKFSWQNKKKQPTWPEIRNYCGEYLQVALTAPIWAAVGHFQKCLPPTIALLHEAGLMAQLAYSMSSLWPLCYDAPFFTNHTFSLTLLCTFSGISEYRGEMCCLLFYCSFPKDFLGTPVMANTMSSSCLLATTSPVFVRAVGCSVKKQLSSCFFLHLHPVSVFCSKVCLCMAGKDLLLLLWINWSYVW